MFVFSDSFLTEVFESFSAVDRTFFHALRAETGCHFTPEKNVVFTEEKWFLSKPKSIAKLLGHQSQNQTTVWYYSRFAADCHLVGVDNFSRAWRFLSNTIHRRRSLSVRYGKHYRKHFIFRKSRDFVGDYSWHASIVSILVDGSRSYFGFTNNSEIQQRKSHSAEVLLFITSFSIYQTSEKSF